METDTTHQFRVREAFVIIALKMILMQLAIGLLYFTVISLFGLANVTLEWKRITIFFLFESCQILFSLYAFLNWYNKSYEIKLKEIVFHHGVFTVCSDYYSLERLESVKLIRSLGGMLLGFGSIKVLIHHNDKQETLFIHNIKHPHNYINALEKALQSY